MSAQAGVFFFDRRPIEPSVPSALGQWLDPFGPDTSGTYAEDGLAMVYRGLHMSPEDHGERQPYISPGGNVITWDGRLDNRDELVASLWRDLQADRTDAALALAAYERWGRDGLSRLIGDWSCVIFDRAQQKVILASDYMGIRPLYLCVRADATWWATTLECLVEHLELHEAVEPRFLVGVLSGALPPGLTPYRDLVAIPPACTVTMSRHGRHGQPETARFWTFDIAPIRYRDPDDYESELRHLFLQGVRGRLRSSRAVWAELSGGLDSSSVVCAAHVLLSDRLASAPRLETLSYVPYGSPESDERRFVEAIDTHRGQQTHFLPLRGDQGVSQGPRSWVTPLQPSAATAQGYELMRRSGGLVLLGGEAGDSAMGNYRDYHYDVASLLPWHPFRAVALGRRRALASQRALIHVMRDAWAERLPRRLLASRRFAEVVQYRTGRSVASDLVIADWFAIRPEYVEYWRAEQLRDIDRSLQTSDVAHRRPASELIRLAEGRYLQNPSEEPLVLKTYPYVHRPLVEFVLGVPTEVLVPPGRPRDLMRRAFAPFVPPRIINRFSKGYAAPAIARQAREIVGTWLQQPGSLRLTRLDCIDPQRLVRYLETVRDNAQADVALFVRLFAIEQWLVAREHRRHIATAGTSTWKGGEDHGVSEAIA